VVQPFLGSPPFCPTFGGRAAGELNRRCLFSVTDVIVILFIVVVVVIIIIMVVLIVFVLAVLFICSQSPFFLQSHFK
jgi:hypothetical protein